jgi:2-C-methyl-D-erythritol 4-phosphate cytidylyltransferase
MQSKCTNTNNNEITGRNIKMKSGVKHTYSAIILAGGAGSRMNHEIPKQFLKLAGKPMIMHTLERLNRIPAIDEIIISCHPDYKDVISHNIKTYMLSKEFIIINGGKTRQESSYLGVMQARNDRVMIHEAARPFVTESEFENLLLDDEDNVIYGIPIPFTVVKGGRYIKEILNREELYNVQLPQKYFRASLLEAHIKAETDGLIFTEDASMLYYYTSIPSKIIEGSVHNVKITTSQDLEFGEVIYSEYIVGRN